MTSLPQMILFSLAVFGDLIRELPANKRQSWNFWLGNPERVHSFNRKSFANSVSDLLKTERIEKVIKGGKVVVKITPRGLKFLSKHLNLEKFCRGRWDEKWRVVIFDINEKDRRQRDTLRDQLRELGFGMLQESVWIFPYPIEEELTELLDTWKVKGEILVSRLEILSGNQRKIAARVWGLADLNEAYRELNDDWEFLDDPKRTKEAAFRFQQKYFDLLRRDPFLPEEILPPHWSAKETRKIYAKEVNRIIFH